MRNKLSSLCKKASYRPGEELTGSHVLSQSNHNGLRSRAWRSLETPSALESPRKTVGEGLGAILRQDNALG